MTSQDKSRADEILSVWDRPEPTARATPSALSRERIVRAAIDLADRDDLAAVSLRKVGAALDAGPMRLYAYISTKEELLELMVDAVYGEMISAAPPDVGTPNAETDNAETPDAATSEASAIRASWRDALRTIAGSIRRAARENPWFSDLMGGRPPQGPNALFFLEASFAALGSAPEFGDIDVAMRVLRAVNAYVIGAVQGEIGELRAEQQSGLTRAAWQLSVAPHMTRMMESGRFPHLTRLVRDAAQPGADAIFDEGLEFLLDGIAAQLPSD